MTLFSLGLLLLNLSTPHFHSFWAKEREVNFLENTEADISSGRVLASMPALVDDVTRGSF